PASTREFNTVLSCSDIEQILKREMHEAQKRHEEARSRFSSVMDEIPTGLPHPDGKVYIQNAGREDRATRDAWQRALKRFSNFVVDGIVPDDLRDRCELQPKTHRAER